MDRLRSLGMLVLSFGSFIVVWQLVSTYVVSRHLIPPPTEVLSTAVPMLVTAEIPRHVAASLTRVAVGFALGSAFGIVTGVLMGRIRSLHDLLDPVIEFFRFLSPTAMIPIAVIWFGIGETSKYFLIFWGTFFIVLINAIHGVMATPWARVRAAECLGATQAQIFTLIVLPSAVPSIVTGMRVALGSSYLSIIPAEILAADSGLGFLLQQSSLLVQTNRVFVVLAVFGALGYLSDRAFRFVTARLLGSYLEAHATA
ncbi:MAG: nitrate ABC transporter permease [Candidatus Rokuibacteriota bacterium]|nr:MAG: nitrate ABC transporter permease [Candidatus Rokubacteria bacterium]